MENAHVKGRAAWNVLDFEFLCVCVCTSTLQFATPSKMQTTFEEEFRCCRWGNTKETALDLLQAKVYPAGHMISSYQNLRPWFDPK